MPKTKGNWIIVFFIAPFFFAGLLTLVGVFEYQITYWWGRGWWIGLLVPAIVLLVAAALSPFIAIFVSIARAKGGRSFSFFWGTDKKAKEILEHGEQAIATVLAIGESSRGKTITINDQPYLNLRLEIDDGRKTPYQVSFDTIIPRATVPQFQPGASFPVKVDPQNPQIVVYDSSEAQKTGFKPSIGGQDWTPEDHKLLEKEGKDGLARLLSMEDTDRTHLSDHMVRVSYEVYLPGETPYTVSKEIPVPVHALHQLKTAIGKTFPAKIHPTDPQKIVVDIRF